MQEAFDRATLTLVPVVTCRHGVPIEVSNRFGLRTCDFYALGAVGIQDIFV